MEEVKLNYPNIENIYITGHSLGGYQAINAGDRILEDDNLADIKNKLRRVVNFNGPGFNNQEAGLSRAIAQGNMFTRYLVDKIDTPNGLATIGQMPNDVKVPYKKTINNPDVSVHNLTSFFYTLDRGYRSSKLRFRDSGNYPLITDLVEVKNYLLTLPESPNYVIDPSGTIINSVTSKALSGAKVTVYFKDANGKEKVWNADDYSQLNPVLTSVNGEFAWDVPEGLWKVKVSKEGYISSESDWLPVAPVQTGIDFKLVPKTYALTFNLGGGSVTHDLPSTYQTDVEVSLESPTRNGYIFEGWYDNPDFIGNKIDSTLFNSVGDKTLWAKWALARQVKTRQESRVITSTERDLSRIEPQAKKVYRGTKQVSQVPDVAPIEQNKPEAIIETKVRQESRALKTDKVEYVDDSSLDVGKVREVAAINGKVLVEITDVYVNGELQSSTEKELLRIEPQAKKVYRGIKQVSQVPDIASNEVNRIERNNIMKEHQGGSSEINTKLEPVVMKQSSSDSLSSKETTIRTKGYLPNTSSEYSYGFELAGIIALATAHFGIISNKRKKNIKN